MTTPINIYTILMCEKLEDTVSKSGKSLKIPNYGSSRIVGYYTSYADAQRILDKNICDVWETCYDYACIERVEEGIYRPGAQPNRRCAAAGNAERDLAEGPGAQDASL